MTEKRKCYGASRQYRSEKGIAEFVYEILPDELTLYPELHPVIWRSTANNELKTIFREVEIVPYDEANPHAKDMLAPLDAIKSESVSEEHYAKIMWHAFRGAIKDLWKQRHRHVILTSSGYDSRLMAFAIKDLYDELGKAWLGKVWFLEADGESEQFRKNMDVIGWEPERCIVYNEGAPIHEYHKRSFCFDTAWEKIGGMSGFPVNFIWEGITQMQEQELIPFDNNERTQVFSGYSSNETAATVKQGRTLYDYHKTTYLRAMSGNRAKLGDTMVPFQHLDVLTNVLKYGKEHLLGGTGLAQIILKHHAPTILSETASMKHRAKRTTVRKITDGLLNGAVNDYNKSWFGKLNPDVQPTTVVKYDPWWAHWCVASFCEQLLRDGNKICVS